MMSGIAVSTATCRRPIPIFQDYESSFLRIQLDHSTLIPHTRLPRGLPPIRAQYLAQDPPPAPYVDHISEISPELSGAADKAKKKYIPKKFPIFPPVQTYKATGYFAFEREKDISKIREQGAEDRRYMEGVLHRQLDERQIQGRLKKSSGNEQPRKTEEFWEKAMREVSTGGNSGEINAAVVNASAQRGYLRTVRPAVKKQSGESNRRPAVGTAKP